VHWKLDLEALVLEEAQATRQVIQFVAQHVLSAPTRRLLPHLILREPLLPLRCLQRIE